MDTLRRIVTTFALVASLFVTFTCYAAEDYSEASDSDDPRFSTNAPPAYAMVGDLVLARPLGLVLTTVGTGLFIVSLPFTALGGNVGSAADALVVTPARETFVRCLGCTRAYSSSSDSSDESTTE